MKSPLAFYRPAVGGGVLVFLSGSSADFGAFPSLESVFEADPSGVESAFDVALSWHSQRVGVAPPGWLSCGIVEAHQMASGDASLLSLH